MKEGTKEAARFVSGAGEKQVNGRGGGRGLRLAPHLILTGIVFTAGGAALAIP
jgi:hypothetical protein